MAGTSRSGTIDLIDLSVAAHFSGATTGLGLPFSQWENGNINDGSPNAVDLYDLFAAGGVRTAAEEQGTAGTDTITARSGSVYADRCTPAYDWFERIHILPRTKIDFGNIITTFSDTYLIHCALRTDTTSLSAVVNNASPGVELPDLTPPLTVYPLQSLLRSTSTSNNGGAALGILAQTRVQALQDGLPVFDSSLEFLFAAPANDVTLLVTGRRIVLIPAIYEAPLNETLSWLTDVAEALTGAEQRIALRKNPRQSFDVRYLVDGNDRQRLQNLFLDWADNFFGLPLWHEHVKLTANVSAGTTTYAISGANDCDFRVGGLAVIFQDSSTYDVVEITSITNTLLNAVSGSVNAYSTGAMVVPLRIAVLKSTVSGVRHPNNLEEFSMIFEVTDNNTGVVTESTTPGFWSTYNSKVLFDDPNYIVSTMQQDYNRRVHRIDNGTGLIEQQSLWDRGKRSHAKGFILRTREELMTFRRLLSALRGKQKSFYIPTFIEDVTVVATLTSGASTMDIQAQEYVRLARNRLPHSIMRITFTGLTQLVRTVQSSATVSTTVERLTLDTTWPSTKTAAEVLRVEFYELVRFDTDDIVITHERIGRARSTTPLIRTFDAN
jgi:hypothetical protein